MLPELTNLLPPERVTAFRRMYFFRLATLAAFFLIILIGIHSVLLLPTHMLLASQIATREAQLAATAALEGSPDEAAFAERLNTLTRSTKELLALGRAPSSVAALAAVLEIPHQGVELSGLSYATAGGTKKAPTVTLTGIARQRDNLRQYQLALQGAPFASAAELPVATYAKDTDIPFVLTLTLVSP